MYTYIEDNNFIDPIFYIRYISFSNISISDFRSRGFVSLSARGSDWSYQSHKRTTVWYLFCSIQIWLNDVEWQYTTRQTSWQMCSSVILMFFFLIFFLFQHPKITMAINFDRTVIWIFFYSLRDSLQAQTQLWYY